MEQLQSHIWLTATSYMGKYLRTSSYIRKPFLIYDFATAQLWLSLYMREIWFSFLSVRYAKKKVIDFPSPAGMSLTKLPLGWNYEIIPAQGEFVSNIPTGDGKSDNLFYSVRKKIIWKMPWHDTTKFLTFALAALVHTVLYMLSVYLQLSNM